MAAAQDGDAASYRSLLQAAIPPVRAVVRASGVAPDSVDDVVQECLIAVHHARHTYEPARPFLPWLQAIARRRAVDALRGSGRRSRRELHDPISYETAPDPSPGAVQTIATGERAKRLRAAVADLPPAQRQAVERLGFDEETLAEASAATGRTTVSLKVNLHRALANLRRRLAGSTADE